MFRLFLGLLGAILLVVSAPDPARAGIPIPCTGEKIITVQKLPPDFVVPLAGGAGVHLDLGYKFDGCSNGEWVGYSGSGRGYYKLTPANLQLLLQAAGLKELPPEPGFWSAPSVYGPVLLWIGLGGFALIGTINKSRGTPDPAPQPDEARSVNPATDAALPNWVERAAAEAETLSKARPRQRIETRPQPMVQRAPRRAAAAAAPRATFGRRV